MQGPVMVISRSHERAPERDHFEDALRQALLVRRPQGPLVVPCVYDLTAEHPAWEALRALGGDFVMASWLSARACRWVLVAQGLLDPQHSVTCLNLARFSSVPEAADELLRYSGGDSPRSIRTELSDSTLPPRWYPVIDHELCRVCRKCHDFCLFGVYSLDESRRVLVTSPDNCKPGCAACARLCPAQALMFPLDGDPVIAGELDGSEQDVQHKGSSGPDLDGLIEALDEMDC